jgi:hypothetical protein
MCICINCKFYKTCWIKKGLRQIPKNFFRTPLNFAQDQSQNKTEYYKTLKETIALTIQLNRFCYKNTFEFDVIECEGFCENPGNWLN